MDQKPVLKIGVMGYSGQKFSLEKANRHLKHAFKKIRRQFPDHQIEIVSGLTFFGIPALAYCHAAILGWKTKGIACSIAKTLPCFPCDTEEIIGDNWGDESARFLDYCDIFVRVGGGKQTKKETFVAKSSGKTVLEYGLRAYKKQ